MINPQSLDAAAPTKINQQPLDAATRTMINPQPLDAAAPTKINQQPLDVATRTMINPQPLDAAAPAMKAHNTWMRRYLP
ncbi:hypothetical protein NDU88_001470 [Pleurodeles waltl]|uniref:Uncharacterized protein n=1 Tax=Pleurodeles waltl TaxID=8319 RepID=A0AAV7LY13_PLEWA|nr:hypothetical protein NDU88_001470 [Pleurodeles waltl]